MKEKERILVGGLVVLMLTLWLGFLVHRSPRFAGSFWGGMLAVSGSLLMLVPLAYLIVKRIAPLKRWVTRFVTMRTLLSLHIYAGVLGPILVLLHTGHKFVSPLGVALTALTLVVVVSGFVGRYLMPSENHEIQEKQQWLADLTAEFHRLQTEIANTPKEIRQVNVRHGPSARFAAWWFSTNDAVTNESLPLASRALHLCESISDVEYAIRTHKTFKRIFSIWLKVHIVLSFTLYGLMGLHVWASIHFGLRWFT